VSVQVPDDGRPDKLTLPVITVHVGRVIEEITGGEGVEGCSLITTLSDGMETHPCELVTVKVYVLPAVSDIVVLVPELLLVNPPGFCVTVQLPDGGNPFRTTLLVDTVQLGCVTVPINGGCGKGG
jgi:hypothetical protein